MAGKQDAAAMEITWDIGTGYDFLASLEVLHFPDAYELRGAWAAGVRSRLPNESREFLEKVIGNFRPPLNWLYNLSEPKDAASVLLALKRIPAEERLFALRLCPVDAPEMLNLLQAVSARGSWDQDTQDEVLRLWRANWDHEELISGPVTTKRVATILNFYEDPKDFGQRYLESLQYYYEVFFSEEEKRIGNKLQHAIQKTKKLAEGKTPEQIVADLTDEIRESFEKFVLVPSYWHSPGSIHSCIAADTALILFGARPPEESLVPGEIVPDDLLHRMKAMTDPTRLRILRYLLQEQLTPAELARRLRLRAPTVTHHLHTLKKAGMVHYVKKGKNEHLYYAKMESIKETYGFLKDFLEQDVNVVEGLDLFDSALF
jgi:DNA-binding transcriptional ArsR family regulator